MSDYKESVIFNDPREIQSARDECGANAAPSGDAKREAEECPECDSTNLSWQCVQKANNTPDGRLRLSEVSTIFVLGCNDCSETIRTEDGDDIAARLRQSDSGDDSEEETHG